MTKKHSHLANGLLKSSRIILLVLIFLLPLFFLPLVSDLFEINKQTLFLVLTFASALLWIASMLLSKKVALKKGWINIFPALLLIPFLISAWFSEDAYLSWIGSNAQEYTSVITTFGFVLLFYLIVNLMGSRQVHKQIHLVLLLSSFLTGLIGILSLFSIQLFSFEAAGSTTFNTVGTMNSFAIFMIAMTMFAAGVWVSHKKFDSLLHKGFIGGVEHLLIILLHIMTLFVLLVLDYWVLWLLFIVGFMLLFVFITFRPKDFLGINRTILQIIMVIAAIPFWLWLSTPFQFQIPTEVTPNTAASQFVSKNTLQEFSGLYGSGPGTYQFDYTKFHGSNINQTDFWDVKFNQASTYFWTLLPTVGGLGLAGILLFLTSIGFSALVQIFKPSTREWLQAFAAFYPWIVLVIAAALYPFNITLLGFLMIFSGLLGSQVIKKERTIQFEKSAGLKFLFSLVFILGIFGFLVGIFFSTQRYAAEIAYASAIKLDREDAPIEEVIELLDKAATLNRHNDNYYRALSVALLYQVNEFVEDTEVARLTQEKREYIQALVGAAVNASIRATEISPNNVSNWELRGRVYRDLSSLVARAGEFAVEAHLKAVELEPDNPSVWTELGRTHLVNAEQSALLKNSIDSDTATKARDANVKSLQAAQAAYEKAKALKPNFASAHFGLGNVYEKQGKLTQAIKRTEESLVYNSLDAGVYFQLGALRLKRNKAGDLNKAQSAFEQAVMLVPTYSHARWYLATIHEKKKDLKNAIIQVEQILKHNPKNEEVKQRLQRLTEGNLSSEVPEAIKNLK